MAATDEQIAETLRDDVNEKGMLIEHEVRGRKLRYQNLKDVRDFLNQSAGLASARRGISVGRIQRPTS